MDAKHLTDEMTDRPSDVQATETNNFPADKVTSEQPPQEISSIKTFTCCARGTPGDVGHTYHRSRSPGFHLAHYVPYIWAVLGLVVVFFFPSFYNGLVNVLHLLHTLWYMILSLGFLLAIVGTTALFTCPSESSFTTITEELSQIMNADQQRDASLTTRILGYLRRRIGVSTAVSQFHFLYVGFARIAVCVETRERFLGIFNTWIPLPRS